MHELISPDSDIDPLVTSQSGVWCKRTGVSHLVVKVPTISAYTRWNCLATVYNYRCQQIEINTYPDSPLFISMGFRRQPDQTHLMLLQMSGDVHPNPGPATKYPCPVCTRNVTSRGVSYKCTKCYGWVHAKCSGILNAAQYWRKGDWTCDACLAPQSQQSPPPTRSPTPPTKQISDDSTFNVLQLNANGIGNKLTELEVVLERNKVKVAVIQESKLSPKSKNPCIQNYTTVRKDRSHGQGGGLLIFIHRSITFSKQPSSPESLSDPHLDELSIKAELGNTKLIISNVYIPPASNGYHSSIEHLLTIPDILILGDFNTPPSVMVL